MPSLNWCTVSCCAVPFRAVHYVMRCTGRSQIIRKEIPADILHEDDQCIAFRVRLGILALFRDKITTRCTQSYISYTSCTSYACQYYEQWQGILRFQSSRCLDRQPCTGTQVHMFQPCIVWSLCVCV